MNLSPHFSLEELTISQEAARRGLDNEPDGEVLHNLMGLAQVLERVRESLQRPINISSGYRSPEVNAAVGGSKTSAHCKGLAVDMNCPGLKPRELAEAILKSGVEFDQLILEYDRWVHFGLTNGTPRRQVLTIRQGTGYMEGLV